MNIIVQHGLDILADLDLSKESEKQFRSKMKKILADAGNIELDTQDATEDIRELAKAFQKTFSNAGVVDIDFEGIMQKAAREMVKELQNVMETRVGSLFGGISGNANNAAIQELLNRKSYLYEQQRILPKQILKHRKLMDVPDMELSEFTQFSKEELKAMGTDIDQVAGDMVNKLLESQKHLKKLKADGISNENINEFNNTLIEFYQNAFNTFRMSKTLSNKPDILKDKSILEEFDYEGLQEGYGDSLTRFAGSLRNFITNQVKIFNGIPDELKSIDRQINDIQRENPEIVNIEQAEKGVKSLEEIEDAYKRVWNAKTKLLRPTGKSIEKLLAPEYKESVGLQGLYDSYINLSDDSPWEEEYMALLKYVKLYESYLESDNEKLRSKTEIKDFKTLYKTLKPFADNAENMLQKVLDRASNLPITDAGDKSDASPKDTSEAVKEAKVRTEAAQKETDEAEKRAAAAREEEESKQRILKLVEAIVEKQKTAPGRETGTFYNSKMGSFEEVGVGQEDSYYRPVDAYIKASDEYDTSVHSHNTNIATPSVRGDVNDFTNWINAFDSVKKHIIKARQELLSFDFTLIDKTELEKIADEYRKAAEQIYQELDRGELAKLGTKEAMDEELNVRFRQALDDIMQKHQGIMTSIQLPQELIYDAPKVENVKDTPKISLADEYAKANEEVKELIRNLAILYTKYDDNLEGDEIDPTVELEDKLRAIRPDLLDSGVDFSQWEALGQGFAEEAAKAAEAVDNLNDSTAQLNKTENQNPQTSDEIKKEVMSYDELRQKVVDYLKIRQQRNSLMKAGQPWQHLIPEVDAAKEDITGLFPEAGEGLTITSKMVGNLLQNQVINEEHVHSLARALLIEIPEAAQQAKGAINVVAEAQEKLNATENQNPLAQDESGVHNANADAIEKEEAAIDRLAKMKKAVRDYFGGSKKFTMSREDTDKGDTSSDEIERLQSELKSAEAQEKTLRDQITYEKGRADEEGERARAAENAYHEEQNKNREFIDDLAKKDKIIAEKEEELQRISQQLSQKKTFTDDESDSGKTAASIEELTGLKSAIETLTQAIKTSPVESTDDDVKKSFNEESLRSVLSSITYNVKVVSDTPDTPPPPKEPPAQQDNVSEGKGPWALENTLNGTIKGLLENIKSNTAEKSNTELSGAINALTSRLTEGITYHDGGDETPPKSPEDENLEKLEQLRKGYEELGKLQAKYDISGNLKLKEEADLLEKKLKIERQRAKAWTTVGQDNDLDHMKDKAYDDEFLSSLASQEEKEKLVIIRELEQLYKKLGVAQGKAQYNSDNSTQKEIEDTETLIAQKKLLIELNESQNKRLDAIYNSSKDVASNEARQKGIQELATKEKELGKLQAQSEQKSSAELDVKVKQLQEEIGLKQRSLNLSEAELNTMKQIVDETKTKELERLGGKQADKDLKAKIKESQRESRLTKAGSTYNRAVDTLGKAIQIEGISEKEINRLQEYEKKIKDLNEAYKVAKSSGELITPEQKEELIQQTGNVNKLTLEIGELISQYDKFSGDNTKVIGKNMLGDSTDMEEYKQQLSEAVKEATDGKAKITGFDAVTKELTYTVKTGAYEFTEYTAAVRGLDNALVSAQGATKKTETFFESVQRKTKELSAYVISSVSIYDVFNKLKQGVQYVKDIDTALTDLKKVTDETEESYDRFLDTASKTADRIGSTITNVTEATATFARLGYSMDEASKMAESALVYQNVGDDIESAEAAAQSIISTMTGFGLEASNTMAIVDSFNEVGNRFAIGSKGIGDALQRSASAMSLAGNTMHETIGLITAAM